MASQGTVASGKTLNAANFKALGAARLAELLLEISTGNATARRQLRLALAGSAGSTEVAREVAKRLASIARSRSFLDWQKIKPLAADLDAQRRAILGMIAPSDPREAFELIWRLVDCAETVFARSDDSSGQLSAVFHDAAHDLGPLAQAGGLDPADLARRAFGALCGDRYGHWEDLVPTLAPQLGGTGLLALRTLLQAWQSEPVVTPPKHERRVIGWSSGSGEIYADTIETNHRRSITTFALKQIADALGDIDGYIAQFDAASRTMPAIAAAIAQRLLDAGRPQEAWDALEIVEPDRRSGAAIEWEQTRIDALEALGRAEEAQAFRWKCFVATLNADHLRAYLRKLPDFEDFEAEQRAMRHALAYGNVHQALDFLIGWPDMQQANQLVMTRTKELDGNFYELLAPAADALEEKYPLASSLLRRAMIGLRSIRHGRPATKMRRATFMNAPILRGMSPILEMPRIMPLMNKLSG